MSENSGANLNPKNEESTDYEILVGQILMQIENLTASGFEQMIFDLLIKMGYEVFKNARSRKNPAAIHGIIIEDHSGYIPVYVQARKLEKGSIITSWNMHSFSDAVSRKGGKGLLITNANFSRPAQDYAKSHNIILIDGNILARLMIANDFCVNVREIIEIKSINPDAFINYK